MAGLAPGRSAARVLACALLISIAALLPTTASAASSSALEVEVDVAGFSQRAAAYTSAHVSHRADALAYAEEIALEAQEAEAEREEDERLAALAATRAAERARATTTTAPPATTTSAPTTVPPTTTAAVTTTEAATTEATTTTVAPTDGPTAEQWAALRYCESGGRYDAVNPNGRYRGAYQFSQATWDWVAGVHHASLVGVDPAAATPADQDAQAYALYDMRGSSPWPTCGAHLQ